jgi:hypothetical protein
MSTLLFGDIKRPPDTQLICEAQVRRLTSFACLGLVLQLTTLADVRDFLKIPT